MTNARRPLDPDKLKEYSRDLFGHLSGAMTSAMIYLGDHLGLYRALNDIGPANSPQLAQHTGLDERWIREWLYQQGAARMLEVDEDGRFSMSPEAAVALVDENHPAFGAGFFGHLPETLAVVQRLPEAFRNGLGLPYDAFGPEGARGLERGFAPWFRSLLVPMALPRIEGLVQRLEAGESVADVGCGAGVAIIEMARAFPNSQFHGYDVSRHALERAEQNRREARVDNVHFHDVRETPLPDDGSLGFVTTFDCLHDMTRPDEIMTAIHRSLRDDGDWLVADIKSYPSYAENLEHNPMAALMYGMSVTTCMSSALSEPGGLGLGTLGMHEERLTRMAREAGFESIEPIDLGHPVNAFYRIRSGN
ncbi:methyltransferase domain-containing protein [Myxococcota bacterium]|nr:methyltransferase domain-containing protein [Myxococcota bacterium]